MENSECVNLILAFHFPLGTFIYVLGFMCVRLFIEAFSNLAVLYSDIPYSFVSFLKHCLAIHLLPPLASSVTAIWAPSLRMQLLSFFLFLLKNKLLTLVSLSTLGVLLIFDFVFFALNKIHVYTFTQILLIYKMFAIFQA